MRRLLLLALLALFGCAACAARQGGLSDQARSDLRRERVCWAGKEGVYVARGDGSGASRIVEARALGDGGVVFLPSMPRVGPHRILFLSMLGLDGRDSTGTALTLNVLDLDGERIAFWRRVSLAKIVPAGADGRVSLFSVPAVAWSADGGRIALALRREDPAGDGLILMDATGNPTALHAIAPARFSRGTSLAWSPAGDALTIGLEDPAGGDGGGVIGRVTLAGGGGGGAAEAARVRVIGRGAYPAVSPDGERIAVVTADEELAVLDRDGARLHRLERPVDRSPNRLFWSGDGRHLYYYALTPSGPLGLGQVTVLRCLDTREGGAFDLVRLR